LEGVTDVIHLAARVHITQETSTDAYAAFRAVNNEGTLNLPSLCRFVAVLFF
jgi:UDP-glucose 4-epimerase